MANNLFNLFNKNSGNSQNNLIGQLNSLRSNPLGYLAQRNLNIPPEIQNDPKAIVQHLLNTGQMSQNQFNQIQSTIQSASGNNVRF